MALRESVGQTVRETLSGLRTGRKWKSSVDTAQKVFKLKEVMQCTQTSWQGFDQSDVQWLTMASTRERREMLVQDIPEPEDRREFRQLRSSRSKGSE